MNTRSILDIQHQIFPDNFVRAIVLSDISSITLERIIFELEVLLRERQNVSKE